MNGFDAGRRIKHESPSTLILIVSQFESAPFAREAVAGGASGYVVKSNASIDLIPDGPHKRHVCIPYHWMILPPVAGNLISW
jgi:hypothetical protein